jgi:signal transduction histidine kinase
MDAPAVIVIVLLVAVVVIGARALRVSRRSAAIDRLRAEEAETALETWRRDEEGERRVRELVLSAMRDGILLISPEGKVVFANEAVGRHLGDTPLSVTTLLPFTLREAILTSRDTNEPGSVLVELGVPSRWLNGTITPTVQGHTLVVIRDETEQRRLDAVRRDFVANASHELKTPAATIQATAETLLQAADDDLDAVPLFAARLEREAIRLSRIVADLLDLSRLESGSSLDTVVSLSAVAKEECRRLQPAADDAGVTLELRANADAKVHGSSKDLSLLIRNLVDNAIRYSREGDKVVVEVDGDDGAILLRVRDTGIGIPSRDLPRIFERFYRVDRARSRETGGTGLGLAIVRHVVENHGGTIAVSSELGHGTAFEISLPSAPAST